MNPIASHRSEPKQHISALGRRLALATLGLMSLAVVGCASLQPAPEETVRKLATQRWQALLAGKFDQAYEFATPAFKKLRTVDFYRTNRSAVPVKWVSAEVLRVDCEPQRCSVKIKLITRPIMPGFNKLNLETGLDEVWILEDGQWWMFEKL
jgi:hypothetical protein